MGHFSGLAGAVALAVIVIPVVVRTTEDMLLLVPNSLREAAASLGLTRAVVIRRVCYRAAQAGMLTGVLLAVARISGETAPLLFTALNNQFWSLDLNAPIASLPVVIFQFALSPYAELHEGRVGDLLKAGLSVLMLADVGQIVGNELAGPAAGGLMFGLAAVLPFAVNAGTLGIAVLLLLTLPGVFQPAPREPAAAPGSWCGCHARRTEASPRKDGSRNGCSPVSRARSWTCRRPIPRSVPALRRA